MIDPLDSGKINPQQQEVYKQEFAQGADLFQKSLAEYQNSNIPAQKEAFKDVMQKAMQVMNETAKLCLSKEAQKKEEQVNANFQNFQAQESPENIKDLSKSIQQLKDSI